MTKFQYDRIAIIIFLGIFGLACVYLLINWIFGSRCPKCKKRGMKKIAEARIENNFDTINTTEYFVTYKCSKCGYVRYDNENKEDLTSIG